MKNKKSGTKKVRAARLGQHFLRSRAVAGRVAEAAAFAPGDTVLEIGPGKGALTRELLARGARVVAVEKDEALCAALHQMFPTEVASGQLRVVEGDVRDNTPETLGLTTYFLVANIPYYITGEIIRMFLTARTQPQGMSLLVQKEVAERIAREKKGSILALSVRAYGTPHYVQKVPAGNFSPPPSVDSAILVISDISRAFFQGITEETFFSVVRAGFSAKRKILAGNLSNVFGQEAVGRAYTTCDIPAKARAEDVPLETWKCLTKALV